jgi:glutamine cyclotransferase
MATSSGSAAAAAAHGASARPASSARPRRGMLLVGGAALLAAGGWLAWRQLGSKAWIQGYRVVAEYPHDPEAYCQGLIYADGVLFESTGRNGTSSVRRVELATGAVLMKTQLPASLFGEGLALVGDRLIQLTWEQGVARIYDRETLRALDQFEYEGEGWGLTYDGRHLIMSDGSEVLTFRDPTTFAAVRKLRVLSKGAPVQQLNELEMVDGELWANIWKKDYIVRIDPDTGTVLGFVDLAGLFDHSVLPDPDSVLNGIAYDPASERLFVTGKLWPKLFEIEVVRK